MTAHDTDHELPVTAGFSIVNGKPSVYCAQCKGIFDATPAWAEAYLERLMEDHRMEQSRLRAEQYWLYLGHEDMLREVGLLPTRS